MADIFEQMHAPIEERTMDFTVIQYRITVLSGLFDKFNRYFPELKEQQAVSYKWTSDSFIADIEEDLPATSPPMLREAELMD